MKRATAERLLALSRALGAPGAQAGTAGRLAGQQTQLARAVVLPAQDYSDDEQQQRTVLRTRTDDFGGVSVVSVGESEEPPRQYRNVDGYRVEDGRYAAFMQAPPCPTGPAHRPLTSAAPVHPARACQTS